MQCDKTQYMVKKKPKSPFQNEAAAVARAPTTTATRRGVLTAVMQFSEAAQEAMAKEMEAQAAAAAAEAQVRINAQWESLGSALPTGWAFGALSALGAFGIGMGHQVETGLQAATIAGSGSSAATTISSSACICESKGRVSRCDISCYDFNIS